MEAEEGERCMAYRFSRSFRSLGDLGKKIDEVLAQILRIWALPLYEWKQMMVYKKSETFS